MAQRQEYCFCGFLPAAMGAEQALRLESPPNPAQTAETRTSWNNSRAIPRSLLIHGISAYICIKISLWRRVNLSKNVPLTEENQAARMHFTNKALKSSIVFMFLSSLQHFLVLSKQTHFSSCILLFKNLRTASQGQHQIAKGEKSTEQKSAFFPPDIRVDSYW